MTPREESIVKVLIDHPDKWLTRRDIARLLGLKKSPYLINILDSLVERGVISRELGSWGGFSCWFFNTTVEQVQKVMMFPVEDYLTWEKKQSGE